MVGLDRPGSLSWDPTASSRKVFSTQFSHGSDFIRTSVLPLLFSLTFLTYPRISPGKNSLTLKRCDELVLIGGYFVTYFVALSQHPSPLESTSVTSCFSCPSSEIALAGSHSKWPKVCRILITAQEASNRANSSGILSATNKKCVNYNLRPIQTRGPPLNGRYPHPILFKLTSLSTVGSQRSGRNTSASLP